MSTEQVVVNSNIVEPQKNLEASHNEWFLFKHFYKIILSLIFISLVVLVFINGMSVYQSNSFVQ